MDPKGKVAIVTGASEGIGRLTARYLADQGAKLVLAARSSKILEKFATELPDAIAVTTDMRRSKYIERLVDAALEHYGRIDILVNNAGQGIYGPVETIDIGQYQSVIELNVFGPLRAMQAVIPAMRSQGGGVILNVSSLVSKNYFPNLGAYASTKYALNALSLTARTELAKYGIIVSVFHPRMTATAFGKNAIGTRPTWNTGSPGNTEGRPMPPIDAPEQVAERIVALIRSGAAEDSM